MRHAVQFVLVAAAVSLSIAQPPLAVRAESSGAENTAASRAIIHLANGDYAAGALGNTADPGVLPWQCDAFIRPFEFALDGVNAIHFPRLAEAPRPEGDFGIELAGGDTVFGSLVGISDKEVVIDSPIFGRMNIQRQFVRRLMRWGDNAGFVYVGPNGLEDWKEVKAPAVPQPQPPRRAGVGIAVQRDIQVPAADPEPAKQAAADNPETKWSQETGHLVATEPGATIFGDVKLPAKAMVEFEISWRNKADFVLALADRGLDTDGAEAQKKRHRGAVIDAPFIVPPPGDNQPSVLGDDQLSDAFRIEVMGANVLLMRDLGEIADLALLENLGPGAGRLHWQVYLDQPQGRAIVYSADGKKLGELTIADSDKSKKIATGVRLINKRGDVRLERLRVSQWNGDLPQQFDANKSRLHKADGQIVYGQVRGYDPQRREFVVASSPQAQQTARLKADEVSTVVLPSGSPDAKANLRASLHDGTRLAGTLVKVAGGQVVLSSAALAQPIAIPLDRVQSLFTIRKPQEDGKEKVWQNDDGSVRPASRGNGEAPSNSRFGRLQMEGIRLYGELVDGAASDDATALIWRPLGSRVGSPLRHNMSGRIVYREPRAEEAKPSAAQLARQRVQQQRLMIAQRRSGRPVEVVSPPKTVNPSLYLRVGDNIPCEVRRIDETGITFHSPVTETTFVPHDKVKAVELSPEQPTKNIPKTKFDRLLTLPRMQKLNPPTHLIVSKNGDYLRGRVDQLNEQVLAVEVRLENREIPRELIARMIWLHPELPEGADAEAEKKPLGEGLVQTIRRDGHRLTFAPQRCEQGLLSGQSEVLGQCRVDLSLVDQLLFGTTIDDATSQLAFFPWTLQDAVEPKYVQEENAEGEGGATAGTESSLVGEPAPDFALPLLDGKAFKLSQHKGEVIVLDFFATWCGPCIKAMPAIDGAVAAIDNDKVRLIAVNMQEEPKQIEALLRRLELDTTVALDRDGATAEKYGVTAIPQTVVIDREGKVSRVFIGGGPKLPEQLTQAIQEALGG